LGKTSAKGQTDENSLAAQNPCASFSERQCPGFIEFFLNAPLHFNPFPATTQGGDG